MKKSRDEFLTAMKNQKFGVELELTGITKSAAKELIGICLENDEMLDNKGRKWSIKYDGSIYAYMNANGEYIRTDSREYCVEMVSPILEYEDIDLLLKIVRSFKLTGGISGEKYRAGLHIHVSDEGQDEDTLRNLIRLMSSKQFLIERALNISDERLSQYCRYVETELTKRSKRKFHSMNALKNAWNRSSDRYHMLNLSSLFSNKGIEFRMFNGSVDTNVVKAYIQFALALSQSAKDLTRVSVYVPKNDMNDKYAMHTWLNRMYLTGYEFKTCRKVMLKHLTGDTAFADPDKRKSHIE